MLVSRGFSTVDLVSESSSDRLYALKKIRCHSIEDEQAAEKEINYHRQINHPSVIQCLGSLKVGGANISNNQTSLVLLLLPFYKVGHHKIVFKKSTFLILHSLLFQYGSLQSLLEKKFRKKETLAEKLIVSYFQQVAEGLAAIHKVGAAHRDLKPGNVLLAPNERVVIMDLGMYYA